MVHVPVTILLIIVPHEYCFAACLQPWQSIFQDSFILLHLELLSKKGVTDQLELLCLTVRLHQPWLISTLLLLIDLRIVEEWMFQSLVECQTLGRVFLEQLLDEVDADG